jgi:exodeoxyribonuclease VII large subunit
MVSIVSACNINYCQHLVEFSPVGAQPHPPLALKSRAAMLDSGGMSKSEDNPPTLASLRARRSRVRTGKRPSSAPTEPDSFNQADLFSAFSKTAAVLDNQASETITISERSVDPYEKAQRKSATMSSVEAERRIWSVRALVTDIRQHVETAYTDIWVEGEICNCRPAPSGHIYFTLKDGEAQLPVVLFRRQASLLRFRLADGLAVLVRGRVSVYESRGQLQLIGEIVEPRGAGALQLAFEQLKGRLLAEGLFDAERKRPLPAFPKCIGVITSPTGAVIRDIITIVRRRHARMNLLVYPAIMQGVLSPASVAAGIRWFNVKPSLADVIVIARGGGSLEDLAGFNDEGLARAIAASELAIVSAIGHEIDFTIADFVADLRAATPSAAAELVTAAQHRIEERITALAIRVQRAGRFHLMHARQRYARLSADSVLGRLRDAVDVRDQRLDELRLRLDGSIQRLMRIHARRLAPITFRLRRQDVSVAIVTTERRLQGIKQRLCRTTAQIINVRRSRMNQASVRLEALSPLAVLSRGYALIYADDGKLIRSAADTATGARVRAHLANGTIEAKVTHLNLNEKDATETSNS